jgi:1-deoxy-D-xylulose-5-phosphate reductoisomerase
MRKLAIFGSTGSIGTQTLDVARTHPDQLQVVCLAAGSNADLAIEQAKEFKPQAVAMASEEAAEKVADALGSSCVVSGGTAAVEDLGGHPEAEVQVHAITGIAGLRPMLAALRCGRHVAFATKEPLVAAGELVLSTCCQGGGRLAPIDSEISALWQCVGGPRGGAAGVERILLTASGGPFRTWPKERIESATVQEALNHPTWDMGAKITVDSASLMNKGLEVVEAMRFFQVPLDRISVIVHPQSIVHSMVEFADGSTLAQLGRPDMRLPIQYAIVAPERPRNAFEHMDWSRALSMEFEPVDMGKFPCLRLAYEAARAGGTATTVLNAANEVANAAFLKGEIPFGAIARTVEHALESHEPGPADTLRAAEAADAEARDRAEGFIAEGGGKGEVTA